MAVENIDLVREGYGIRFPQCKGCHKCTANNNFQDGAGGIYAFNVNGFSGSNVPFGTVEVKVTMVTLPSSWSRQMRLTLFCIIDSCRAFEAFHDPAKNEKPITGYVQIR